MKTAQFVVIALVLLGINANLVAKETAHKANLTDPSPCQGDTGSQGSSGQGSCVNGDFADNIRKVSFETAIEDIAAAGPIVSFTSLANHVIMVSKQALGYSAVVSDETLASLAWIFRLRHMPEPVVIAEQSTRYDAKRLVRHVLTNPSALAEHHWKECAINELIAAVETSVQEPTGFVFRMIPGDASEYGQMGVHRLTQRVHIFAAVHTQDTLKVSVYSASLTGDFIKGHGGADAVAEREEAAMFMRQWLLNQWVNIWTCTNPGNASSTN